MTINENLNELENKIKYNFNDIKLLRLAMTHKSYAYEFNKNDITIYNERIEYLGDAILEHSISIMLYNIVPYMNEGIMTKKRAEIVCEKSLASAFNRLNGSKYILVGKCENKKTDKPAIIADAFESLIGAIYIDSNFDTVNKIILDLLDKEIDDVLNGNTDIIDYKTLLQEALQKNGNVYIEYITEKEIGPDHDKTFYVAVKFDNKIIGKGIGKSIKQAEQKAAEVAYEIYKN
ncbi:MAG: ribonuclease III [Clostridia bacterium]